MKITSLKIFGVVCMLLALFLIKDQASAQAATSNLSWTANTESDLAGYKVYRGQGTTQCSATTALPALTVSTAPVLVLAPATAYVDTTVPNIDGPVCYEITAYDTAGNESLRSTRAQAVLNRNPPGAPANLRVVIP
jgi:hypothetical protein